MRVALTGGIATGKSRCLKRFEALGARTIDTDVMSREAVALGTAGLAAVTARFGESILHADGTLNRGRLGQLIFADAARRSDLEAIVHPAVYAALDEWFVQNDARGLPEPAISVTDIPLVYETGHEGDFDAVVVTRCRPDQQLARLIDRDRLTPEDARRRIDLQLPTAEKVRRADFVVDTSQTEADTDRGVDAVWTKLIERRHT
jgi:dephospho-CoA kinase